MTPDATPDDAQGELTRPATNELALQVLDCRAEGLGRNATSRILGVSTRQIDNISKEHNITWGGDHVAVANRARAEQARATRLELADKFRKLANIELDAALDGQDSPQDRKQRVVIAAVAVDKDLAIAASMGDNGDDAAQAQAIEAINRFGAATRAAAMEDRIRREGT